MNGQSLQVHVDREAEAKTENTDDDAKQQQVVTADPIQERYPRKVRKL
jgi:hypothetical protein